MTRHEFFYYPNSAQGGPKTIFLDWNVATRLESLYNGNTLSQSPEIQQRLLNLAQIVSEDTVIVSGFAASEPEARPSDAPAQQERFNKRANIALELLKSPEHSLEKIMKGQISAKQLVDETTPTATEFEPQKFSNYWIRPNYVVLLKSFLLSHKNISTVSKLEELRFFLKSEINYRPSRELIVGTLLIAGNNEGRSLATSLLKSEKTRTSEQRVNDLWGAAWDLFYSRLPGFQTASPIFGDLRSPSIFVTDDEKLLDTISGISLLGTLRDSHGLDIGTEGFPIDQYIEAKHLEAVLEIADSFNQEVLGGRSQTKVRPSKIVHNAVYQQKLLTRQLENAAT